VDLPKPRPLKEPTKNAARTRRRVVARTDSDYAAISLARKHSVEAVEFMVSIMRGDTFTRRVPAENGGTIDIEMQPDIPERVKAAKELLDRGMGRPVAKKEVTHSINDEHLAALKQLARAVEKMPGDRNDIIDVTPVSDSDKGDRAKLAYAEGDR